MKKIKASLYSQKSIEKSKLNNPFRKQTLSRRYNGLNEQAYGIEGAYQQQGYFFFQLLDVIQVFHV